MKPKKLARGSRRKRQQWRDAKRRQRAAERKLKQEMREKLIRVELGGVDMSSYMKSLTVKEIQDLAEGCLFTEIPDVPGIGRHREIEFSLIEDFDDAWKLNELHRLQITYGNEEVFNGNVRVQEVMRVGALGSLTHVTLKLSEEA